MRHAAIIFVWCAHAVHAADTSSAFIASATASGSSQSTHAFSVPLPRKVKSVQFSVVNDNKNEHYIMQQNLNTMRVDTIQQVPSSQPQAVGAAPHTQRQSSSILQAMQDVWSNYRAKIVIGGLLSGYGLLVASLAWMARSIEHRGTWASWHDDLNLQALRAVPQQQLAKDLFAAIKNRYLPAEYTMLNFLDPLVCFCNDCDAELQRLNNFAKIKSLLAFIKISAIVPGQADTLASVEQRIERITYLKQTMVSWLSEYSLGNVTPPAG